jgi:hypothetical protein
MKKMLYFVSLVAVLAGFTSADAAKRNDIFTVRFRENTLVVSSEQMEEARIYTMQGRLLQKERGTFAQFELERGEYRLFAKVNGETVTRRIELR